MTKDEWYVKLEGWAFDDARLHRLPLALLPVLAEHLASEEEVHHPYVVPYMDCPQDLSEWVNSDPKIVWFLYDLDLLPEVIKTKEQVCALRGFKHGWVAREKSIQHNVQADVCPACFGDCERLHNDGLMHTCKVCGGTGKRQ